MESVGEGTCPSEFSWTISSLPYFAKVGHKSYVFFRSFHFMKLQSWEVKSKISAVLFEVLLSSSSQMHWQHIDDHDGMFFSEFFPSWHLLSSRTRLCRTWCMFTYIIALRRHKNWIILSCVFSLYDCVIFVFGSVWFCSKKLCLYNMHTMTCKE